MSFGSWPRSTNKLEKSGILYARKVRFNSTVIEIYGDIIRVLHGFEGCQMHRFSRYPKVEHHEINIRKAT
jgi:hypothetical protein